MRVIYRMTLALVVVLALVASSRADERESAVGAHNVQS
jgi:hypothetical protein